MEPGDLSSKNSQCRMAQRNLYGNRKYAGWHESERGERETSHERREKDFLFYFILNEGF